MKDREPIDPLTGPPSAARATLDREEDFAGRHRHDRHLMVWSATAAFAVHADSHDWVVLPTHGLWPPAGTPHSGQDPSRR